MPSPNDEIIDAIDRIEKKISDIDKKAVEELKNVGKVGLDTKAAMDSLGIQQREFADRLLKLEQKGGQKKDDEPANISFGAQFVGHDQYSHFQKSDGKVKVGLTLKNTVSNAGGGTYSARVPSVVSGPTRRLSLEERLVSLPTTAPAVDWVREKSFTNNAGETAEASAIPQSNMVFEQASMPISTVSHFIKITRQLAMDNAALAAYINQRMIYGVDIRVENQLLIGNGVLPNMSGFMNSANYVPHGYTAASLTALGLSATNRLDIIAKTIGDCALSDYPCDAVIINTADWWTLRLQKDTNGRYLLGNPSENVTNLWGVDVLPMNAMPSNNFWAGSLFHSATFWNRDEVSIDMSEHDENNFQTGLITVRTSRRAGLTVEKPGANRAGLLVPA